MIHSVCKRKREGDRNRKGRVLESKILENKKKTENENEWGKDQTDQTTTDASGKNWHLFVASVLLITKVKTKTTGIIQLYLEKPMTCCFLKSSYSFSFE